MNNKSLIAIVAVIVAVLAIGGTYMVMSGDSSQKEEEDTPVEPTVPDPTITYELNGGIQNPVNPSTYKPGTEVVLQCPGIDDDDKFFGGWFLDVQCTEKCVKITKDMKDNVTLYALWKDNAIGHKLTYEYETMTVIDGKSETVKGTMSMLLCSVNEFTNEEYTLFNVSTTYDGKTQYEEYGSWSERSSNKDKEVGEESLNTIYGFRDCTIMEDESGDKAWIDKELGFVYKIVSYETSYTMIGTLKEYTVTDVPEKVTLKVYGGEGSKVSGSGMYKPGESATISMKDYTGAFSGWLDEDFNIISTEQTFELDMEWANRSIYALSGDIYEVGPENNDKIVTSMPGNDLYWTLYNGLDFPVAQGKTNVIDYTIIESGTYYALFEDHTTKYCGIVFISADLSKTVDYSWEYKGKNWTWSLTYEYSDYKAYQDKNVGGRHYTNSANTIQFVTYEDPYIKAIADSLLRTTTSMNEHDAAQFVLAFVQSLEYELDVDYNGKSEYWKYPLETLFDNKGDCEDTAILYSAIIKAMGYDTALLLYDDHMASSVDLDGEYGTYYAKNGHKYYYAETTSENWEIGDMPEKYNTAKVFEI